MMGDNNNNNNIDINNYNNNDNNKTTYLDSVRDVSISQQNCKRTKQASFQLLDASHADFTHKHKVGQDGCPSKRIYNKQTVGHFILKEEILSSTGPTQGAWIIIGNKGPTFLKDIQNHDNFSRACEFHDIKRVLDEEGNVLVEYEKDRPECLKSTDGPSESSIIAGITNCHTYVDDGDKTTVKSEEEFTISACDLLYEDAHCPCGNLITADHVPDQCQIVSNGHSMGDINPSMKRSADAAIPTKEKKRKSSKFTTETEKLVIRLVALTIWTI